MHIPVQKNGHGICNSLESAGQTITLIARIKQIGPTEPRCPNQMNRPNLTSQTMSTANSIFSLLGYGII